MIPYAREAGALLLLGALGVSHWFAWDQGGKSAELDAARKENKALSQAVEDASKANDERRVAQKKLDRLAKLPPKVVTLVRENPSNCNLAQPVADGLREQVRETNAAIVR